MHRSPGQPEDYLSETHGFSLTKEYALYTKTIVSNEAVGYR